MRLLVFFVVAFVALVTSYAFGLGGAVATLIFLAILTIGVLDRWMQPIIASLRG
jgi:hypothetical protein